MGQKYLIDTCVIIKYLENLLPPEALLFIDSVVDDVSMVSFITQIELLVWNPPIPEDIQIRKEFLAGSEVFYINDEIINRTIQIRKETNIKLPDAVIAATALYYDFILLSTNENDFKKVASIGLKYLNPEIDF